jgi:hypothetical protein
MSLEHVKEKLLIILTAIALILVIASLLYFYPYHRTGSLTEPIEGILLQGNFTGRSNGTVLPT